MLQCCLRFSFLFLQLLIYCFFVVVGLCISTNNTQFVCTEISFWSWKKCATVSVLIFFFFVFAITYIYLYIYAMKALQFSPTMRYRSIFLSVQKVIFFLSSTLAVSLFVTQIKFFTYQLLKGIVTVAILWLYFSFVEKLFVWYFEIQNKR